MANYEKYLWCRASAIAMGYGFEPKSNGWPVGEGCMSSPVATIAELQAFRRYENITPTQRLADDQALDALVPNQLTGEL